MYIAALRLFWSTMEVDSAALVLKRLSAQKRSQKTPPLGRKVLDSKGS
jgi:hypothetical protein